MSPGANEISKGNDTKAPEARENAGDQDAIGLRLKSDWWGKRSAFSGPITERSKCLYERLP